MSRILISIVCTLVIGSTVFAHPSPQFDTRRVKDLGTYRLATGEWISPEPPDSLNLDVNNSIYDNTCLASNTMVNTVGVAIPGEVIVDVGQIPSPTNLVVPGATPFYTVEGWRWAVCPGEPNTPGLTMTATMFFLEKADSCVTVGGSPAANVPVLRAFNVSGLPTGGMSNVCYTFNVDIEGTTLEFDMIADGDGTFGGPGAGAPGDTFASAMTLNRSDGAAFQGSNAFGLGGDPGLNPLGQGCQDAMGNPGPGGFIGESTIFLNQGRHLDGSTGLGNVDGLERVLGVGPICFDFGYSIPGNTAEFAGLYHEIYGIPSSAGLPSFSETCVGDGGDVTITGSTCTPCPCGNDAPPGSLGGCINSAATSTRLLASGTPSIAVADLRFEASGAPPANSAVLTSGNALAPANPANPCFGLGSGVLSVNLDGLRCVVQGVLRHGVRPSDANGEIGVTTNGWGTPNGFFNFAAFTPGGTKHFQIIHRDVATAVCQTGQNTSQAVSVTFTL